MSKREKSVNALESPVTEVAAEFPPALRSSPARLWPQAHAHHR